MKTKLLAVILGCCAGAAGAGGCAGDDRRGDEPSLRSQAFGDETYADTWEGGGMTPEESTRLAPSDGPGQGATRPELRPYGATAPYGEFSGLRAFDAMSDLDETTTAPSVE